MSKYRFDQIAFNSTEKKKPVEEDKYTYLGLENLDPENLKVTRFGSEIAPIGEKLLMKKGDVLFGKRRAYQKKVAIAPFDGIFSAHGMVLRPIESIVDKYFFPFFISSDYFLDSAIKISVGSLSPTINWKDLKELEFNLPEIDTQRKISKVLWSINDTLDAYESLVTTTELMTRGQLSSLLENEESDRINLGDLEDSGKITLGRGQIISKTDMAETPGDYPVYSSSASNNGEIGKYGKYMFDDERITWSIDGGGKFFYRQGIKYSVTNVGGWLKVNDENISTKYLYYALTHEWMNKNYDYVHKAHPSVIRKEYQVYIPSYDKQEKFINIAEKNISAKLSLEKTIKELKRLYKKIQNNAFILKEDN